MTQLEAARANTITPEMKFVASREDLPEDLVRSEVARGRMVIPANRVHLAKRLEPMGIGIAALTKINANIGNSAVTSDEETELQKLHMAVHYGADFSFTPHGEGGVVPYVNACTRDVELLTGPLAGAVSHDRARAFYEACVDPGDPNRYIGKRVDTKMSDDDRRTYFIAPNVGKGVPGVSSTNSPS